MSPNSDLLVCRFGAGLPRQGQHHSDPTNFKDFKINYYVQHRNSKIMKYASKDTIL